MYTETKEHCIYCNWDGIRLTMCKPCEDAEQAKISKAYDELIAWEKEVDNHNASLISRLGKNARIHFKELMDYCNITGKIEVVNKPSGDNQKERYGPFKKVYVQQWSVGMEGDSFAGDIYAKTDIGWLKIPYSC